MHILGVVLTWLVKLAIVLVGGIGCYVAVDRGIDRLTFNTAQSLGVLTATVIAALLLVFALNYVWAGIDALIIFSGLAVRFQEQLREEARLLGSSVLKGR